MLIKTFISPDVYINIPGSVIRDTELWQSSAISRNFQQKLKV